MDSLNKRFCLTLLASLLSIAIYAQDINLEWAKSVSASSYGYGISVCSDNSGNVYSTGRYSGTADFNPGSGTNNLTSNGKSDIFIQKLDASGNFIWAKSIGGANWDFGLSIITDASGFIYVTGTFEDSVDFNPGASTFKLYSNGSYDVFILKLDSGGNFIWAKSLGASAWDQGQTITLDPMGNVYVIGYYRYTVDFDPGSSTFNLTSNSSIDVFILKLNSNGNFIWVKSMGGKSFDQGFSISIDALGYIYTTGWFRSTADFDPGSGSYYLTSNGQRDIFIQKLDSSGNFVWAKSFGGLMEDQSYSITTDISGNIYVTGYYQDSVDFNPGSAAFDLTSNGGQDIFIQKLDPGGNFIWAKSMGGTSIDQGFSISIDALGCIYTTGWFRSLSDFDPGVDTFNLTPKGSADIFIQKLDSGGNFIWVKSIGGTGYEAGNSIAIDTSGNVYMTGFFENTVDFDPSLVTYNLTTNNSGIFVLKLSDCPDRSVHEIFACDSYSWVDGNTYTASNDSVTYTMTNVSGCDSIITLNLTIKTVDISVIVSEPIITANAIDSSYQWLDCNNNYAKINGETSRTFTATVNGRYAVEVTQIGCKDTSECVSITTIDIEENTLFSSVSIFPNPNNGIVNIDFGKLKRVSINVFNAYGELIYHEESIDASSYNFELNGATGFYIIELSTLTAKKQYKLVKK